MPPPNFRTIAASAVFLVPLVVLPLSASPFQSAKLAFLSIVISISAIKAFSLLFAGRFRVVSTYSPDIISFMTVVLALAVISTLTSSNPFLSAQTAACMAGGCIFIFTAANSSHRTLIFTAAAAILIPSAIALAQWHGYLKWFPEGGTYSTIGNPNTLCIWLAIALPFCAGAFTNGTNFIKVSSTAAGICAVAVLYLNRVHGAWMAAAVSTTVFFLFPYVSTMNPRTKKTLIFLTMAVVLILNAAAIISAGYIEIDRTEYSILTRLVHGRDTFIMGTARPFFGWGLGTYMAVFPTFQTHSFGFEMLRAHQEYLQLFSETGLLGSAVFAYITYLVMRALLDSPRDKLPAARTAAAVLVAAMTASFTSFPLHEPVSALTIALALGIALGCRAPQKPSDTTFQSLPVRRKRIWMALPVFTVALALFLLWSLAPFVSEVYIKRGLEFDNKRLSTEARECYQNAARWNPSNGYANFLLGGSYAIAGDYDSALAYLEKASRTRDFGSLHYILGYIYYHSEDYKKAEYEFIRAQDRGFRMKRP